MWGWRFRRAWRRPRTVLGLLLLASVALWAFSSGGVFGQVVLLQGVFPSPRKACPAPDAALSVPSDQRFALVTVFDGPMWSGAMGTRSEANKQAYADRHGYTLHVTKGDAVDRSRPVAWTKIKAVRRVLQEYDWVFYIDCDALIMNPQLPLSDLVAEAEARGRDFVLAEDWNGPNSGVWLLRNSPWSVWFLDKLWDQAWLVNGPFIFEYEQRAFHYLMDTKQWRDSPRGHRHRYEDAAAVWEHVQLVPQCALNSYVLHPFTRHDRAVSQYVPGDFVLHLAGYKGTTKELLFDHYASEAERRG